MDYTVDDYNVTIKRGFVREDGKVLWGKNPRLRGGLEWRLPDAYKKNVKQKKVSRKARYDWTKAKIDNIKLDKGCEICGFSGKLVAKKYQRHIAMMLEFDHIDTETKTYNICDIAGYSWDVIQNEIDKCRVLCKPCHTKHTGDQNRKD